MTKFSSIEKIFIALTIVGGSLILFFPIQYLLVALLGLICLAFLMINPKYCFYLVIFTIPFTERVRILPISFSPNDICVLLCILTIVLNLIYNSKKIDLKTSLDGWNLALLILYFVAGFTSIGPTGILTSFKFLEAISMFYITVYLMRSKQISLSNIIKAFLFTGLFQAILGILQSTTGLFGAAFQSQRGYLGYLGIGSTTVWHAWGTFGGNGMLPEFLFDMLLLLLPFYKLIKKVRAQAIVIIFSIAIYMGYSKESLFTLLVCGLVYYYYNSKNKSEAIVRVTTISFVSGIISLVLANTPFLNTVNETVTGRQNIWSYPIYALTTNMKYLWLGSGLNSYWEIVDPLLPLNVLTKEHHYMLAHNYYLLAVQEIGLIGAGILFSFFVFMGIKFFKNFNSYKGYYRKLNLSAFLFVITIFTTSFFGQFYYLTFTKVLMYMVFGIILSKENFLNKSLRSNNLVRGNV